MTKSLAFTQGDVTRALRGARAAGVQIDRVEIEIVRSSGNIVLRPAGAHGGSAEPNEWDSVLPREAK